MGKGRKQDHQHTAENKAARAIKKQDTLAKKIASKTLQHETGVDASHPTWDSVPLNAPKWQRPFTSAERASASDWIAINRPDWTRPWATMGQATSTTVNDTTFRH